jgi:hypothetical protein
MFVPLWILIPVALLVVAALFTGAEADEDGSACEYWGDDEWRDSEYIPDDDAD